MKRLTFLFTVLMVCIMSTTVMAADNFDKKYRLADSLGILPYTEYEPDSYVTRGELAYIAVKTFKLDEMGLSGNYSNFKDVNDNTKYSKEISLLGSFGVLEKFSDGSFEPEYNATVADVAAIFVKLLGYSRVAENSGGYPNGYISVAINNKIIKTAYGPAYYTQKDMMDTIVSVLESKPIKIENYGSDDESDILSSVFGVTKISGIITANGKTTISGTSVSNALVEIDGGVYSVGNTDISEKIGCRVDAYVDTNKDELADGEIICYELKNTEILQINADDLLPEESDSSTICAEINEKNKKYKKYKISEDVIYIYNGYIETGLKKADLFITSGYLELIDNDNNDIYDIIKITKYDTYFVKSISEKALNDAYDKVLNLNGVEFTIIFDGAEINTTDVQENDIIDATVSKDGKYAVLYVTRDAFSGTLTSIDEEGVTINGDVYKVLSSYRNAEKNGLAVKLDSMLNANFYLNAEGKIAAVKKEMSTSEQYGILYRAYYIEGEDKVELQIFTSDGTFVNIKVANKVTVDKKRYKSGDYGYLNDLQQVINNTTFTLADKKYRPVIIFKINADEEINYIDTAVVHSENGETADNSLDECEGMKQTNIHIQNQAQNKRAWNRDANSFEGISFIGENTIIFQVPMGDNAIAEKTLFKVLDKSTFIDGTRYYVTSYDVSKENEYNAGVIIIPVEGASKELSGGLKLIKKVVEKYDEENSEIVTAVIDSNDVEYMISDKELSDSLKLSKGDVVRFGSPDSFGMYIWAEKFFDADGNRDTKVTGSDYKELIETTIGSKERYSVAVVTERIGNRFRFALLNADGTINRQTSFLHEIPSRVTPIVYDSESNEIYAGTMADLDDVIYSKNPDGRICFSSEYGILSSLYICK